MRQTISVLLAILLLAPDLPATTNHDWNQVRKIKADTRVTILLWNGERLTGYVEFVDDSGLHLNEEGWRPASQNNQPRQLNREAIRKIVRLPHEHLPNPEKWMAIGTIAGAGAGVTAGAISDVRHGSNGRWFVDGFAGAGLGILGSCMVLVGVGVGATAHRVLNHKIIYEASSPLNLPISK